MTFEDRVTALDYLGFTHQQTSFLVTVALHSGYCLRRQFATFAGLEYGKSVRSFLDRLVDRGLARLAPVEMNRGHIYHLYARPLYRALEQDGNRNRRTAAPALIARKLMLLDFVLAQPVDEWFATEQDKVALFADRYSIPLVYLPRRRNGMSDGPDAPARYFLDKWPIFLTGDPPTVSFVFLATDSSAQTFERFLIDHAGILERAPRWEVVVVSAAHAVDERAFRQVLAAFTAGTLAPRRPIAAEDLRWYFTTRRAVEQDNLPTVSAELIDRFQTARRQFAGTRFEGLYADWLTAGDAALARLDRAEGHRIETTGTMRVHTLPFTYTQLGTLPGAA